MIGPSYDADQQLLDEHTGRTIYRRHTDGTVIWHSNIVSADKSCPYGDASVPSQVRRQNMYNDMYRMMKKDGEQFRAQFNYALPNEVPRETAIACAEEIAKSLSERFHRPVDYSIHNKPGNLHVHISMPEWRWENGHWGSKDRNYYPSKTGERLYAGDRYTDDNGNDLRIPKMETVALPDGTKIEQQATDKKTGRRLWIRKKERFLTPVDCSWIHDQIDHCINFQLFRMQSIDRVRRPDRKTREQLKAAGLVARHVGPASYRNRDERYDRITENNNRVRRFEKLLTDNRKMKTEAENEISVSDTDANALDKKIVRQGKKINAVTNEINALEKNRSSVVSYIEDVLQPANVFANEAADQYETYSSMKKGMARPLLQTLEVGLSSTQEEMAKIKNAAPATGRRTARMNFLSRNAGMMTDLHNGLHYITEAYYPEHIRENAREKWRGLSGWKRANYVKSRMGETAAIIYQEYAGLSGNCPDSEKIIPSPLTVPDMTKIQNQAQSLNDDWKQSVLSDDHMPPTNIEILSEMLSLECTVLEISTDGVLLLPDTYNPQMSRQIYERELQQIERDEQAEAARKAAEEAARIEQERQEAEQRRIAAERRRQEEAHRQEEERRLAEQKRIEEARLAEQKRLEEEQRRAEEKRRSAEQQSVAVTVAATQGAATSSQTGIEHRPTKRDYYELSDRASLAKLMFTIDVVRAVLNNEPTICDFRSVLAGIEYYEKKSKNFRRAAEQCGFDYSPIEHQQNELKRVWELVKEQPGSRPAFINQKPTNLIPYEQLNTEEERYKELLRTAQQEKSKLIESLIRIWDIPYKNYENKKRTKYNREHSSDKGFRKKPLINLEESVEMLRKNFTDNTAFFEQLATQSDTDISAYTIPAQEASKLKEQLDESYIYYTMRDKQKSSSLVRKRPSSTKEHTRGKRPDENTKTQ